MTLSRTLNIFPPCQHSYKNVYIEFLIRKAFEYKKLRHLKMVTMLAYKIITVSPQCYFDSLEKRRDKHLTGESFAPPCHYGILEKQ